MRERVNQVNEALKFLERDPGQSNINQAVHAQGIVYQAARDYVDLLTRREDGSAYEAIAEWLMEERGEDHRDKHAWISAREDAREIFWLRSAYRSNR